MSIGLASFAGKLQQCFGPGGNPELVQCLGMSVVHGSHITYFGIGPTWTPKVCKVIAFKAVILGLGQLFHILLGFRKGMVGAVLASFVEAAMSLPMLTLEAGRK